MSEPVMEIEDIREYAEGFPVELGQLDPNDVYFDERTKEAAKERRWVVCGINQGGYDRTVIDLQDLFDWIRENKTELWKELTGENE